ncbi:MAG: VOC family protein, partial [Anaerolineae bacterium]|nr:VOC family protein [Anaerolineae bacterium]
YKPETYNSVSPYLIVDGASATIDFLKTVFDAVELRRFPSDGGHVMHAEVRLDDTVVMIADAAEGWPAMPAHVHIYVPDVDATYQRALAVGAASVQAPVKKDDADKRGGVKDAGGTTWWLATKVE